MINMLSLVLIDSFAHKIFILFSSWSPPELPKCIDEMHPKMVKWKKRKKRDAEEEEDLTEEEEEEEEEGGGAGLRMFPRRARSLILRRRRG